MAQMLKIGELASRSGLSRYTIRFYEREAMLPTPARTPAGYRLYSPDILERLDFIKRTRALGFSLTEIRKVLGNYADPEECRRVKPLLEQKITELDQKIREAQALHDTLSHYLGACRKAFKKGGPMRLGPAVLDMPELGMREASEGSSRKVQQRGDQPESPGRLGRLRS